MNTSVRIYGKGYRETGDKIQPGSQLRSLCIQNEEREISFRPIIIPGEPNDIKERYFSGTETYKAIVDDLLTLKEPAVLDFYSLQTWEGASAVIDVAKKVGDLIVGVNLIHPNRAPVYSISAMDWATSDLESRLDEEKYLTESPEIFSRLMQPAGKGGEAWRGNPIQFQKDLQRYHSEAQRGEGIDYKVGALRDLGIQCKIHEGEGDVIVNKNLELKSKKRALFRHIPNKKTIAQVFNNFQ